MNWHIIGRNEKLVFFGLVGIDRAISFAGEPVDTRQLTETGRVKVRRCRGSFRSRKRSRQRSASAKSQPPPRCLPAADRTSRRRSIDLQQQCKREGRVDGMGWMGS